MTKNSKPEKSYYHVRDTFKYLFTGDFYFIVSVINYIEMIGAVTKRCVIL